MAIDNGFFPRDEKGNLLTKTGCQTPGCDYPNWHVCLVGKESKFEEALENRRFRSSTGKGHGQNVGALVTGLSERWERHREENRERDANLVRDYEAGDVSVRAVSEKYGIAYQTARRIIVDAGVEIRKRGSNVRWESQSA